MTLPPQGRDRGPCRRFSQEIPGDASLDTYALGETLCDHCAATITKRRPAARAPGHLGRRTQARSPGRIWAKPLSWMGFPSSGERRHLLVPSRQHRFPRGRGSGWVGAGWGLWCPACPSVWPLWTVEVAWGPEKNHQDCVCVGGAAPSRPQPGRKRAGTCCPEGSARFPVLGFPCPFTSRASSRDGISSGPRTACSQNIAQLSLLREGFSLFLKNRCGSHLEREREGTKPCDRANTEMLLLLSVPGARSPHRPR